MKITVSYFSSTNQIKGIWRLSKKSFIGFLSKINLKDWSGTSIIIHGWFSKKVVRLYDIKCPYCKESLKFKNYTDYDEYLYVLYCPKCFRTFSYAKELYESIVQAERSVRHWRLGYERGLKEDKYR